MLYHVHSPLFSRLWVNTSQFLNTDNNVEETTLGSRRCEWMTQANGHHELEMASSESGALHDMGLVKIQRNWWWHADHDHCSHLIWASFLYLTHMRGANDCCHCVLSQMISSQFISEVQKSQKLLTTLIMSVWLLSSCCWLLKYFYLNINLQTIKPYQPSWDSALSKV